MKIVNVRVFALAATLLVLVPLAGCGSGGSSPVSTVSPLPAPSPSVLSSAIPNTSDTGVTTRANYDNPNFPYITVTFQGLAAVGFGTVAEYHIYRNDDIVTKLPVSGDDKLFPYGDEGRKTTLTYADGGFALPIEYRTIGAVPTQVLEAQSTGVEAFSADTPIVYRITLLYGTLDRLGQATYTETEVGRSNQITPFR